MPLIDKTGAITRYLLGDASEEERNWAETQMLADEDFLEQCQCIEDQLVDDYALGHLDDRQRELFEKKFLDSPRIQAKLKLVHSLVEEARRTPDSPSLQRIQGESPSPARKRPGFGFASLWPGAWVPATAFALAVAALVVASLWTIRSYQTAARLQDKLAAAQQEEARLQQLLGEQTRQQAQVSEQLERERALSAELQDQLLKMNASSPTVAALTLLPGGFRTEGTSAKNVAITPETKRLRLELLIEPGVNYPQYQVRLEQSNGEPALAPQSDLHLKPRKTAEGQFLAVSLPTDALASGDYLLVLEAKDNSGSYTPLGSYNFHVTKKQAGEHAKP